MVKPNKNINSSNINVGDKIKVNVDTNSNSTKTVYLNNEITYRDIGRQYEISGERVRQIIEKFARKAYHFYKLEKEF